MFVNLLGKCAGLATPLTDYVPSAPSLVNWALWTLTFFFALPLNMMLFWNLPTGGLIGSLNNKANPKKGK